MALRRDVRCALAAWLGVFLATVSALGCGLDWTLPQAHFEGVEEHGHVAYWEKIGAIDLGGGAVLPVHIGFNSSRETSSSVLGKGWIVALLESHVEPVSENAMNVIMPDGWTFLFLRNGNTETWRGNAGWMGETNDSIFTITAPCGWKIKYDGGKIQEIDGDKIGTLTYAYNGGVPTEIDRDGSAVLAVERDPASGVASGLVIDGQRVAITLGQRPRVISILGQNLINGLDPSLASLQWPEGKHETFVFGTDKALDPTLTLTGQDDLPRTFVWDAATRQIKSDGEWSYQLQPVADHLHFTRVSAQNGTQSYEADDAEGMTSETGADGANVVTWRFVSGPLAGYVRKIERVEKTGKTTPLYSASYYPSGELLREIIYPDVIKVYSENRQLLKETIGDQVIYEQDLDGEGRVVHMTDATREIEVKMTYDLSGGRTTQVFERGMLFYTEQIDAKNKLVSLNEGEK